MNTTPTTTKGEQAKNQLIAAALAQFGEYGLHATTRDIAAQAGQNIAAITYYFGSKEDLYLACARWIADFIDVNFRPHVEAATRLLELGGASAASRQRNLDRHWRNIRTITLHNPVAYKARVIGQNLLDGTPVPANAYF